MRILFPTLAILFFGCQAELEDPSKVSEGEFKKEFLAIWEDATDYTMEVLDRMPEKEWDKAPAKGSMSFRRQFLHIEENLHGLTDRYLLEKDTAFEVDGDSSISKTRLKRRLKEAFEKVRTTLKEMPEEKLRDSTKLFGRMKVPKTRVFLLMRDHMTHHRAQMILALRQAGKEPPNYKGW